MNYFIAAWNKIKDLSKRNLQRDRTSALRKEIAVEVMKSILYGSMLLPNGSFQPSDVSKVAISYADALIEELKRKDNEGKNSNG